MNAFARSRHILILAILALAQSGNAQIEASPDAFVRHLYALYAHPAGANGPSFLGRDGNEAFSLSLLGLIHADRRAARGQVGKLDGDPVCDCQDSDGLQLNHLTISNQTQNHATAHVALRFAGPPSSDDHKLTLYLIRTDSGWRIDDISTGWTASLRKFLTKPLK